MKYFNKFLIAALVLSVAVTGCKKSYFDVNNDPNRPNDENIKPELIYNNAAVTTGARMAASDIAFINRWIGYWSTSGDFAIDQQETSYNIDFSFSDATWRNQYDVLFDLYKVQQKSLAANDLCLAGASMILSAKLWQDLVDVFGNVPYSQAFKDSIQSPKYDKGEDVYAALQDSLDNAIQYMKQENPQSGFLSVRTLVKIAIPDTKWDANLDVAQIQQQWIKFANTLKLRLLIRQSEKGGQNADELTKIQANGGVLGIGESVSVNPGFSNSVDKQSSFYQNYGLTPVGNQASTNTKANNYFVGLLKGSNDTLRLKRFYKAISSEKNHPDWAAAIVGTNYGQQTPANPGNSNSSDMGPGLAGDASQDQWILPSFESMFLTAEAVARGWLPGDPQTAFEGAITESFVWLGVPNATTAAKAYITNTAEAQWKNAGSSALEKAQFIVYQKYLALEGVDAIEAWSDIRRLNMLPDDGYITHNPSALQEKLPVRILYPQTEYTTNAVNVKAQGTIDQFSSKIFWQP